MIQEEFHSSVDDYLESRKEVGGSKGGSNGNKAKY